MLIFLIAFLVIHFVENKWKAFFVSITVYLVVSFIYLPYKYNANWNELNLTWLSISNFLSETAAKYIGTFLLSFGIPMQWSGKILISIDRFYQSKVYL